MRFGGVAAQFWAGRRRPAAARGCRGGGRGRGSAVSPANVRSKFPTWRAKAEEFGACLPTESGQKGGISEGRWGVLRACGARLRKSSNDAAFSRCQSLHIMLCRKLGHPQSGNQILVALSGPKAT